MANLTYYAPYMCIFSLLQCNYRYILNMSIVDDSGSTWVTAFNDQVSRHVYTTIYSHILPLRHCTPTTAAIGGEAAGRECEGAMGDEGH